MCKPCKTTHFQSKPYSNFSITYQNIEGLHGALGCKVSNFSNKVKADICFISETWSCDHDKDISGYVHKFTDGYKLPHCKKGRSSGGILLYYKKHLHENLRILKSTPYAIWLTLDKSLFSNIENDVTIYATYIPPLNSKYNHIYTFDDIAQDTMNFCDDDSLVLFLGDFNARSGNLSDNLDITNQE